VTLKPQSYDEMKTTNCNSENLVALESGRQPRYFFGPRHHATKIKDLLFCPRPQNIIDTYTKVSFAKLYECKTPITAADLLNDRVLPFFEEHDVKLVRVLTDRGSEFC
jgi:hypothetical protein